LDLANLFKEIQQYDKAAAAISKVLDAEPSSLQARILRANLYQRMGAADKAIAEASEAVRLHPESAEAYSARASLYNLAEDYDKAIADADHAIRINPRDLDAYLQRGFAYVRRENYNRAIQDFSEAVKLNPGDAQPRQNRGFASARQGKYKEAAADLVQASRLDPKSPDVLNSLAWLLATCPDSTVRDGGKAVEYINQALQLDPNRWNIWDTRAAVSAENGDFKDAVSWEERCLERKDLSEIERRRVTERLALYRVGKPYREQPK
jgi:tetratricopeptide (TPR) repeat protein